MERREQQLFGRKEKILVAEMNSRFQGVFSERKKGEVPVAFARSRETPPPSENPKIVGMIEEILEGLEAIGDRLDKIEKHLGALSTKSTRKGGGG